jgi:hypothetical protein
VCAQSGDDRVGRRRVKPALLDQVRANWERTLGLFVPELPDVEKVFAEVRERLEAVLSL